MLLGDGGHMVDMDMDIDMWRQCSLISYNNIKQMIYRAYMSMCVLV